MEDDVHTSLYSRQSNIQYNSKSTSSRFILRLSRPLLLHTLLLFQLLCSSLFDTLLLPFEFLVLQFLLSLLLILPCCPLLSLQFPLLQLICCQFANIARAFLSTL